MRQHINVLLLTFAVLFVCCKDNSIGQGAAPAPKPYVFDWVKIADSSTTALNTQFFNTSGRYFNANNRGDVGFGYWPQAHALDVLTDAYVRTKDARYLAQMNDWFEGVRVRNGNTWLNEYYDDMLWNALAMLRVYDATNDRKWLDAGDLLWNDIKTGWNDQQGGGIAWRKGQRGYKNTPANAPAVILAARLYSRLKRPADLDWATRIYDYQKRVLVEPNTGFVYDGINRQGDSKIDLDWKFTYNQGVYIGAGLELYRATQNQVYLNDAIRTANNALIDPGLTGGGLLRDEGTGDGGLFKGVLVRYLTLLALDTNVPSDARMRYTNFLKFNGETLWRTGTTRPAVVFGPNWATKPADGRTDLPTQLSGATLMEAMNALK